jgi:predicted AlkP superfamily phosphohydrolase/phosphomutase
VSRRRVLLIGWDGADWKVITPLIEAGKMPNIERLINRGVMGDISTLEPVLSPTLWTSIATGKRPYKHGILGFIEPTPNGLGVQPVSILSRRTRALWNMMTLEGLTSNVVGWWPSHPAEPINGVIVSNHYQRSVGMLDQPWPMRPGTVHPERLAGPLSKLRLHPQELLPEQLLAFVPEAAKIDQEKDRRLHNLAKTIAECASIQSAATALMQLEPWDFMGVYYDSIDHFSHGFMHYHPPRLPHVPEADFEMYRQVIEGAYRLHDMMLGVLLDLAGEDVTVMLISDHGFHPDKLRPVNIPTEPAGPAIQHRTHGIFVLAGPGIKQDERIYGASVLDITPTMLALYDLPVGADMDGKALVSVFEQPPTLRTIPSWDDVEGVDGRHPPETAFDPVEAGEELRQLAALGYIDTPDSDGAKAAADAEVELRYNLARAYAHGLRYLDAITELQELRGLRPEDERFGLQLVSCLNALGRQPEARAVLDETIAVR